MKHKCIINYIGGFPPPYGGVTVKNRCIYRELSKEFNDIVVINPLDIKHCNMHAWRLLIVALCKKECRLVIASAASFRKAITMLLLFFNKSLLRRSVLIVMGGTFHRIVAQSEVYSNAASMYKRIFVETQGMKIALEGLGFHNVGLFPNCRLRPVSLPKIQNANAKLKCVFFSQVSPVKGVDMILDAARRMPDVDFMIYGTLVDEYKNEFLANVADIPNVTYRGIYKVDGDNVYHELNNYDVLLLPTKHIDEGVPGILVEAKNCRDSAMVSDINFNREIVIDGSNGIVLERNETDCLEAAIRFCDGQRDELLRMKAAAQASAEDYYLDGYIGEIQRLLME